MSETTWVVTIEYEFETPQEAADFIDLCKQNLKMGGSVRHSIKHNLVNK